MARRLNLDKKHYLLYVFFALCFLEFLPHLEILINPKIRLFTQQKLIFFFFIYTWNTIRNHKFN